ncbi:MAG: 7-carboxy-7-deazaguanine synthase [Pseudomonadota bacterium]
MTYSVKETFHTLQGEGAQAGRAAVFLRFAGCNLWSGLERDRARAVCRFCDTDFVGVDGEGGGKFSEAASLAAHARAIWDQAAAGGSRGRPYIVCTGGEPLLQLDKPLIDALHAAGFEIAVETNGTLPAPEGLDWICVSPKSTADLKLTAGDELKLVYPQADAPPERYEALDFRWFFLQPMDGPGVEDAMRAAAAYCMARPQWRLSLQTHKLIGIP